MCVRPDTEAATPVYSVGGRRKEGGPPWFESMAGCVPNSEEEEGKIDPYPTLAASCNQAFFIRHFFKNKGKLQGGKLFSPLGYADRTSQTCYSTFEGEPCIVEGEKDKKVFFLTQRRCIPSFLFPPHITIVTCCPIFYWCVKKGKDCYLREGGRKGCFFLSRGFGRQITMQENTLPLLAHICKTAN